MTDFTAGMGMLKRRLAALTGCRVKTILTQNGVHQVVKLPSGGSLGVYMSEVEVTRIIATHGPGAVETLVNDKIADLRRTKFLEK